MSVGWEKRKRRILLRESAYVLLSIYLLEKLERKKYFIQQEVIDYTAKRFGLSNKTTCRAVNILAKHGLVETKNENKFPYRMFIRTTEKGENIAKLLKEIISILAE